MVRDTGRGVHILIFFTADRDTRRDGQLCEMGPESQLGSRIHRPREYNRFRPSILLRFVQAGGSVRGCCCCCSSAPYLQCNGIRFVVRWRIGIWTTKQKKRRVPTLIAARYVYSGRRRLGFYGCWLFLVDHVNLFSSSYPVFFSFSLFIVI